MTEQEIISNALIALNELNSEKQDDKEIILQRVVKQVKESLLNSEKEIYWKPKDDKDRVFNFIPCEVRNDYDTDWRHTEILIGYFGECYQTKNGAYKYCRIKPFDINNPPPVDTLVNTGTEYEPNLRYFKRFDTDGEIECFVAGSTYDTVDYVSGHSKCHKNCSFINFHASQFELMEE